MINGYQLIFATLIIIITAHTVSTSDIPCSARKAEAGYICVCNETYCDTIEPPLPLPRGQYYHYMTSDISPGFTKTEGQFVNSTLEQEIFKNISKDVYIQVDSGVQYQTFIGVGASFTESSGSLINSLPAGAKKKFMESHFGTTGVEYSIVRVPIAAADFSSQFYTYDDVPGDVELKNFSLNEADFTIKIPLIKMANSLSKRGIKVMGSPWTAPYWMKVNNSTLPGYLREQYLGVWAKYFVKYLKAYSDQGVEVWGFTQGNEAALPLAFGQFFSMPNTIMLPAQTRYWTKKYLGPMLKESGFDNVKILTLDDERPFMTWWADRLFSDTEAAQYVDGIALHWYFDSEKTTPDLDNFHKKYPDKIILYTESSINGMQSREVPVVDLGDWQKSTRYINNIFQNFDHWVVGYIDWNIALNQDGGPSGASNMSLDASVIINVLNGEFYKQPMFYALGHFSKFVHPGSKKIKLTIKQDSINEEYLSETLGNDLEDRLYKMISDNITTTDSPFPTRKPDPPSNTVLALATTNPDGSHTLIAYNPRSVPANLIVDDVERGKFIQTVDANSLNTFVYW